MKDSWDLIEQKLKQIVPETSIKLNNGVSDSDIQNLEKIIGAKLPHDFIIFYRVHNGQSRDGAALIDGEELLSFDRIIEEWNIWNDLLNNNTFENSVASPDAGIKSNWWNPLWIPITYDGNGNHYCLDLDPTKEGSYGQIIRMWHDDDVRSLIAKSFKEWIKDYTNKLISGQLVYSEDYFGVVDRKFL